MKNVRLKSRAPWLALLAPAFAVVAVGAQPASFEVATIKVLDPVPFGTSLTINIGGYRNGSFSMNNVTLGEVLQFAYNLVSQDQISGPDWIKSRDTRYEIVGRTATDVELPQVRPMVAALLAERLKVVARKQPKVASFLALVPAKGGPKLQPADPNPQGNGGFRGKINGPQMPLSLLASLLSRFENQLIVDRTGLTGRYQVKLEYTPEDRVATAAADAPPTLTSALEEQLGLRLESRKEPLDAIVVERAERTPTDN
jgi:uncharacterized protein (TIGR03435 family)